MFKARAKTIFFLFLFLLAFLFNHVLFLFNLFFVYAYVCNSAKHRQQQKQSLKGNLGNLVCMYANHIIGHVKTRWMFTAAQRRLSQERPIVILQNIKSAFLTVAIQSFQYSDLGR